jgi:formylglycine-generating enzyme required for sulfatase activity
VLRRQLASVFLFLVNARFFSFGEEAMPEKKTNSIGMTFLKIQPGTFYMGAPEDDPYDTPLAQRHRVTLTKSFFMARFLVTKGQYKQVEKNAPPDMFIDENQGESDDCPVLGISWFAASEFCSLLSDLPSEKSAGHRYRLPTEAEWEYCCRAGSESVFCFGDQGSKLHKYAWFEDNSDNKSHPVGKLKPNNWGLYDFHGNAAEWCSDWFEEFDGEDKVDPKGPTTGENKVLRLGNWGSQVEELTCASRDGLPPDSDPNAIGLRVVLELDDGN